MKEIISLRKPREKHFLNENGTITAYMYNEDIHYFKNGRYKEIDNSLIEKENYFQNFENSFQVHFFKNSEKKLFEIIKDSSFLSFSLENFNSSLITTNKYAITYQNILENIDIKYQFIHNKLKDTIILKDEKNDFKKLKFKINTNLDLQLKNNEILLFDQGKFVFKIEAPILLDKNKKKYPIHYILVKQKTDYLLLFHLDPLLLNKKELYPFIIDPTIINGREENVYDAWLTTRYDLDKNYDAGSYCTVGPAEDEQNRVLLKFSLPELDPSCSIVKATVYLNTMKEQTDLPGKVKRIINVHEASTDWDEKTVTWNNMHDKYNSLVRSNFYPTYNSLFNEIEAHSEFDLTKLVKEWYAGKPNYGIMLKYNDENYASDCMYYVFYSKQADEYYEGEEPTESKRPYLTISYRIQNGIENYMNYKKIPFSYGTSYINNYNGNVVNVFNINKTISNKYAITLNAVYNSAEAVKNENLSQIGYGWRFNFSETLQEETVDTEIYLKYINETGAIHYMPLESENIYKDEDGLGLNVQKENNKYIMKDQEGNIKEFTEGEGIYRLTKITNISSDSIIINYENGKITKLVDADNKEMIFTYSNENVSIISEYDTVNLIISNSKITNITNKFGTVSYEYDEKNLMTKVIDINGLSEVFEYFASQPYRLSKITNYGKNNSVGNTISYEYLTDVTRILENEKYIYYSFDDQGRLVNNYMLHSGDQTKLLAEAYGYSKKYTNVYQNEVKNKVSNMTIPFKYIENLFVNSSFEEDISKCNFEILNANIVSSNAKLGDKALKLTENETSKIKFEILNSNIYTISFDFKSLDDQDILFELISENNNNEEIVDTYSFSSNYNNKDYNRISLTGEFSANSTLVLKIIQNSQQANSYLDNIQLEVGEVANLYNIVNNSNFELGSSFWEIDRTNKEGISINPSHEIEEVSEILPGLTTHEKVLHLLGEAEGSASLSQKINISGQKGDLYHVSFWYKSVSVIEPDGYFGNLVNLQFSNPNPGMGSCTLNMPLYANIDDWQFFSTSIVAENDYTDLYLNFISVYEPNGIYVANIVVNKDLSQISLEYDASGNLIGIEDLASNKTFSYDINNQLISEFNALGHNFKYEYDNLVKDRVLKGISPTGISNEIKYDEYDNPIKTIINNVNVDGKILTDHFYNIRLKGTDKYLMYDPVLNHLHSSNNNCNYTEYRLEKEDDCYKICLGNKFLLASTEGVYFTTALDDNCLFYINKLDNGSYYFKVKGETSKCLSYENDQMILRDADFTNVQLNIPDSAQFYFEDIDTNLFIETTAKYDENHMFISEIKDALGKTKKFQKNTLTGLTEKSIDALGNEISFEYNDQEQIAKVNAYQKEIIYTYNAEKLLNSIHMDNKLYQCTYNDFLNIEFILLNNNTLVHYEYNNDNQIKKITYGNENTCEFEYDWFNRLNKYKKGNKTYLYQYNNLGSLAKIISDTESYKYTYDYANRLSKFITNNYIVDYTYDNNGNVLSKSFFYNGKKYDIQYKYDDNDNLIKITAEDFVVFLEYDYLGRLYQKNVNNEMIFTYSYITNGLKTSCVVRELKIGKDVYKYIYDDLYNITKIFINKELVYEYKYNENNHLDTEINYKLRYKYKYIYNEQFNLIKKQYYTLDNYLEKEENFEYKNSSWEDQLTNYNGQPITYDGAGNIKTLGDLTFEWENSRELIGISGKNSNISYSYNINGIRTKKIVNGVVTEFVLDGYNVILENRKDNVIYYIRDNIGDVIGIKYANQRYYFLKNLQGDIIGIKNNNGEIIANYEYDAWGNILKIIDEQGNPITDRKHIAHINPYRYRGYYYDEETNMYYLGKRYYSPELHRFISIDSSIYQNISSKNLYIYCGNNPVERKDIQGDSFITGIFWGAIGATTAVFSKMTNNIIEGKKIYDGLIVAFVDGAIDGFTDGIGKSLNPVAATIKDATVNFMEESKSYVSGEKDLSATNIIDSIINVGTNTAMDALSNTLGGNIVSSMGITMRGRRPEKLLSVLQGKQTRKYALKTILETSFGDMLTIPFGMQQSSETSNKQLIEIELLKD